MRILGAIAAAGLVINIGEFIINALILGRRWGEIIAPLHFPTPCGKDILLYWSVGFAYAAALTWLYKILVGRVGTGPATAAKAAVALWLIGRVLPFWTGLNKHLIPMDFAAVWWAATLVELLMAGQVVALIARF